MIDIYREDCEAGLKRLIDNGEKVEIIVTSPPYNIGKDYDGPYDDSMSESDYIHWLSDIMRYCALVLDPNGSCFINLGGKPSDPMKPFRVLWAVERFFRMQNVFHWVKSIALGEDVPCVGHVKPVNSERYVNNAHEYLFHLTPTGNTPLDKCAIGVPYADKSNLTRGNRGKNGDLRDRGNVWFIPYETVSGEKGHPAAFPLQLPDWCIRLHGYSKYTTVLDPFMGSGTTLVAAARLGLKGVGFEVSHEYFEQARGRLADYPYRAHFGGGE